MSEVTEKPVADAPVGAPVDAAEEEETPVREITQTGASWRDSEGWTWLGEGCDCGQNDTLSVDNVVSHEYVDVD